MLVKAADNFSAERLETHEQRNIIKELGSDLRVAYAKIDELKETADDYLLERVKLDQEIEFYQKQLITARKTLDDLDNERESQWSKFKRLLLNVLKNPDSPVPLKVLFKTFGVSIAAIIAAITMIFSTIGLAISNSLRGEGGGGGGGGCGGSGGGDKSPSIPDRVREGLKKFAEWLKELAKKSVAALPRIIGSIVSFLLKAAASVVGFLAEHLVILIVIVVSSVIYGLIEGVKTIKK